MIGSGPVWEGSCNLMVRVELDGWSRTCRGCCLVLVLVDVVVAETGTSNFGIVNVPFPKNASCLTQTLWGSIGWATGATMGAVVSLDVCMLAL